MSLTTLTASDGKPLCFCYIGIVVSFRWEVSQRDKRSLGKPSSRSESVQGHRLIETDHKFRRPCLRPGTFPDVQPVHLDLTASLPALRLPLRSCHPCSEPG